MILALGGVAAAAMALSWALTPVAARCARARGFVDHPGPRKVHTEPMPYGGGLAVALAVFVVVGGAVAAAHAVPEWLAPEVRDHAPGAVRETPRLMAFFACAALVVLLGTLDDARLLSWRFKLTVEILVGAAFALGVESLKLFVEGPELWKLGLRVAITAVWIAFVTNLFNLLDHMDGVAAGVAAICSGAFLAAALQTGQWFMAGLLAALLGACLGFLPYNFPPARVFLGDGGSLFLGFFLGGVSTLFTFHEAPHPLYTWYVPAAVLAVPAWDAAVVLLGRFRQGRPLFEGDRTHLCHRLREMGLSARAAVLAIYALVAVGGLGGVLLYFVNALGALLVLGQLALVLMIWTVLERGAGRAGP